MNYVKRATISIKRRPSKTIILLLLVLVLGTIISGAISIQQAVKKTELNLRSQIPAAVSISVDWEKQYEYYEANGEEPEITELTPDLMKKIGELPSVKTYDYSATKHLFSQELKNYEDPEFGSTGTWEMAGEQYTGFELKGGQDPEILHMKEGLIKLSAGRTFTAQEMTNLSFVAVISKELAETNGLSIGSTIKLDNIIEDWREESNGKDIFASQTYDFEIIGIFETVTNANTGEEWNDKYVDQERVNKIYVPNVVVETAQRYDQEQWAIMYEEEEVYSEDEEMIYYENVYILNDPLELDTFKEEVLKTLSEYYIFDDLTSSYSAISASMENMQWLASLVLWVAVGATLLILSLLITLFLRDRRHEMGIYLALGEKKRKVITQILIEVATTALIGMTISLFVGSLVSNSLSESMLRKQLVNQQSDDSLNYSSLQWAGFTSNLTQEDMIESYEIALSSTTILVFYGVGMGTVFLSTIAPTIYVTRLNPKKIMM